MTGKSVANPLAGIVAAAAKALPAKTGETERVRARIDRGGSDAVILADVSSSMDELAGARRKAEILQEAIDGILPTLPAVRLVAFGSVVTDIPEGRPLPRPSGGTALARALDHIAPLRPARTLVVSDGRPDNADEALAAADRLSGTIDVIYVGPDDDAEALAFMGRLARAGAGRVVVHDLRRQPGGAEALAGAVRRLALPRGRA
jgi:hypothetical protein